MARNVGKLAKQVMRHLMRVDTCRYLGLKRKAKEGGKKTVCTRHQFCSSPDCDYYLITDDKVHALVGYGKHGKYEDIQDLICQACRKKFTIRKHTLLYRLKTHSKIIRLVLHFLAMGVDVSALEEVMAIRESTLRTWLVRSGVQGRKLHEHFGIGACSIG